MEGSSCIPPDRARPGSNLGRWWPAPWCYDEEHAAIAGARWESLVRARVASKRSVTVFVGLRLVSFISAGPEGVHDADERLGKEDQVREPRQRPGSLVRCSGWTGRNQPTSLRAMVPVTWAAFAATASPAIGASDPGGSELPHC
jgi:hypothetical protein